MGMKMFVREICMDGRRKALRRLKREWAFDLPSSLTLSDACDLYTLSW